MLAEHPSEHIRYFHDPSPHWFNCFLTHEMTKLINSNMSSSRPTVEAIQSSRNRLAEPLITSTTALCDVIKVLLQIIACRHDYPRLGPGVHILPDPAGYLFRGGARGEYFTDARALQPRDVIFRDDPATEDLDVIGRFFLQELADPWQE